MAITLPEARIQVNLSNVVDGAIASARAVRSSEQAKNEAEFQKAIADGLSYSEQVKIREKQLADEKASGFIDEDYVARLEKSVTDTKKLARFDKYRTTYASTLAELNAGRINEEDYLDTLRQQLQRVDDPDLRLEIQNDITAGEKTLKEYRDTILANQVKKAKYDGTSDALTAAIRSVKDARASARLSDNEDEVTAYDETLAALESQLSTVRIQDSITDFQVKSSTRGTSPLEKLDYINGELSKSDPNKPIRIGDRTYNSAQEFWTLERDGYLAGSSQLFGNFFNELKTYTNNTVAANATKFGYTTTATLDNIVSTFNELKTKPEMQPFINQFDVTQADVLSGAVDTLAKYIADGADASLQYDFADTQLANIGAKYGIDTQPYRSAMFQKVRGLEQGGLIPEGSSNSLAAKLNVNIPEVGNKATPSSPTVPTTTPAPAPSMTGSYTVKQGDTLSAIALRAGMSLNQLLDLNPEFKQNPNLVRTGQNINLGGGAPQPVMPTEPTAPVPGTEPKPQPQPTVPQPQSTPSVQPTPAPKEPAAVPVAQPTKTTPAPQPQPQQQQQQAAVKEYKIAYGDTLSGIARKNNTTVAELARINNIADPNKIKAGATIKLQ